ncbi:hypothetical protein [Halanaerobium hydrogeniformans]|uniref:Uncharacterized protein n=1 Tax=Halanaerobium hydrogeniformans TaxID=656519 RepID=E4RIZ2_HALHG|nr:hypothetical protein [Halanaerobium hydrogeniformans]ADQ15212.1 hypothetical protein Halsa_1794 [Halanaerobium hydrogeniformans]
MLEKQNMDLTDEDLYESMRNMESMINSQMSDTYPLGHFNDSELTIEEIAERLADFDEVDMPPP